jgi:hypothetical protein
MTTERKNLFTNAHLLSFMRPALGWAGESQCADRLPGPGSTFALNGQAEACRPPEFCVTCVGVNAACSVRNWTYGASILLHDATVVGLDAKPIVMSATTLLWPRGATVDSTGRLR